MKAVRSGGDYFLKHPGQTPERVLLGDELKSGGAGSVYSIKGDTARVIKIYHADTLKADGSTYQEKIECMLMNVPTVAEIKSAAGAVVQLAWPLASAYTPRGEFVGFAMPMVDLKRTTELEFILSQKQAKKYGLPHHLGVSVTLAHNLAAIVSSIHARGHAIVDLKPVNLKFYKQELFVAVLDCDGFYVNLPGKKGAAPQVTLDYLAPEFQSVPISNPEHQDRFALAVIIFKLLNYGIHPFSGVAKHGVDVPSDLEKKIQASMYPYGMVPHSKVSPVLASVHETFPADLRSMFDRAFGGSPSGRPGSDEWTIVLKSFAEKSKGLLTHCQSQHLHFKGMPCAECLREQVIQKAAHKAQQQSSNISPNQSSSLLVRNASSRTTHSSFASGTTSPSHASAATSSSAQSTASQPGLPEFAIYAGAFHRIFQAIFLILFLFGIFNAKFWVAFVILSIPLYLYTKNRYSNSIVAALVLSVFFAWPSVGVVYYFLKGDEAEPSSVKNTQTENARVELQENNAPLRSGIDALSAALVKNDLMLANRSFSQAVFELLANRDKYDDAHRTFDQLLNLSITLAQKNIDAEDLEEAEKILTEVSNKLLPLEIVGQSSASSIISGHQIRALLAGTYLAERKYPEAINAAKYAIKTTAVDSESMRYINESRLVMASSLLMINQPVDAASTFESVYSDMVPEQDRVLFHILKLTSNTLASDYSETDSEAKMYLADYSVEEMQEATSQIRWLSSGTSISAVLLEVVERLALASEKIDSDDAWVGFTLRKSSKLGEELRVNHIETGSPADSAGLKSGDIIREIEGRLAKNLSEVRKIMAKLKAGQVIPIKIQHDGIAKYLIIKVEKRQ